MEYQICFIELADNTTGMHFKFCTVLSSKEIDEIAAGNYSEAFDRIHAEAQLLHKQSGYTIVTIFVRCKNYIYVARR
jgi:hypothetical protein